MSQTNERHETQTTTPPATTPPTTTPPTTTPPPHPQAHHENTQSHNGGLAGLAATAVGKAGEIARVSGEAIANAGDHWKAWSESKQQQQTTAEAAGADTHATKGADKGRELSQDQPDSKKGRGDAMREFATATSERAGDMARAGGEAITTAGGQLKHHVTEQTNAAVSKAEEMLDQGRTWAAHKMEPGTKQNGAPTKPDKPHAN